MPHRATWIAGALLTVMAFLPAASAQPAERPILSMKDAVEFQPSAAGEIDWAGPARLIGRWTAPDTAPQIVEWDIKSGTRRILAAAERASLSPDGRWLLMLQEGQWRLKDLLSGKIETIGPPSMPAAIALSSPTWSRDSRRFAILEANDPPPAPAVPTVTEVNGVRFVDVGREADRRFGPDGSEAALMKSRLSIGSVERPAAVRSFDIPEDAAYRGAWGTGDIFYLMPLNGHWYGHRSSTSIRALDVKTGRSTDLYSQPGLVQTGSLKLSPDGRTIAFKADVDNRRWDDFNSLNLLDLKTGVVRRLTSTLYVNDFDWAPDGRSLYLTARAGGFAQIYRAGLDGRLDQLSGGSERHYDLSVAPDGRSLAYFAEDGYGRRELRIYATASGTERTIATLSDPASRFRLATFKPARWKSPDGLELDGLLFLPPGFDPKRKYPMFVDVHGGGPAARLYLFGLLGERAQLPLEWHARANRGYVVFVPNYRSSGEYGPQVAAARYRTRDWDSQGIRQDAADVESGVRWMLAQGYVDPGRVAIFGHSAGGARVNYLLTRTDLFAAAILHDPIPSGALPQTLASMTGGYTGAPESIGTGGQSISDNPAAYTGGFLFDGIRIRTPTLIMVGNPAKGAIDPLSSELLFSLLRTNGIPARMIRYVDDGHNPGSAAAALQRDREIAGWLQRYAPADRR